MLMIVRLVFIGAILGAGLTGSPSYAAIALIPAIILFVTDGWQALAGYVALVIGLYLAVGILLALA